MKSEITKSEIESIQNTIAKIQFKCVYCYMGMGLGGFIVFIALIYFVKNPEIVEGSLSLIFVGVLVFILNLLTYYQRKERINGLNKDLMKTIELYEKQDLF